MKFLIGIILDFVSRFMDACCAWNCGPWKFTGNFFQHLTH